MAERFLVHEVSDKGKAATHAIVIGVGDYPHLPRGSSKQKTKDHEGMPQLTSPPISARKFAAWLIRSFEHPEKPLATVSLLLSERKPKPFVNPRTNKSWNVALAGTDNVLNALWEWNDRGNRSPENLLLFFYSGHGLAAGRSMSLPLADYGAGRLSVLDGALDLNRFLSGMEKCRASEQCFFVDACRTESEMLTNAEGAAGRFPVTPGSQRNTEWPKLRAPVFYSTTKGYKAYSEPNKPSIYTTALLDSLQDLAAEDSTGDWRVSTDRLQTAVRHLIERRVHEWENLAPPTVNGAVNVQLNRLNTPPRGLVYVKTDPPAALRKMSLECLLGGSPVQPTRVDDPNKAELVLQLPTGHYDFIATFPGGRRADPQDNYVAPINRSLKFTEPPR
jgi:Caspase domain